MKTITMNAARAAMPLAATTGAGPPADATRDRGGLLKLADTYFAALVAHDPGKAPLASPVKIVENVTRIKAGEGLWKTATSAPTEFRIVAADPVTQVVGGLVVMQS